MRKWFFISSILVVTSALLVSCGSAATPAAVSSNTVNIQAETNPNPPAIGDIELILTVTDANGSPIEGATVDVSADHIDMTGMTMSGAATDQGAGKYSIQANFSMSGSWKIKVYVRKEGLDYSQEIDLTVQ